MEDSLLYIVIFVLLVFLSALFSATETAYFNLKSYNEISNDIRKLLSKPRRLLVFLLTGNTIVNVAIGSISASLAISVYSEGDTDINFILFVQVIIITLIVLVFGEIIPKTYAIKKSNHLSTLMSKPLKFLMLLFYPITYVLYIFSKLISKLFPIEKEKVFDTEEELKILTEIVEEEGTIDEFESDMIQSVIEFNDKLVKEIFTPRVDIVGIESNTNLDEVMDLIANKKFSKIPVYEDNIDNIKGVLYAKDIIPYLIGSRPKINLLQLSRTPFFIPETKPIDELLDDFKLKRTNIAIVVDEWGGTSGLITLEDVVEEVMGELQDPYDHEEYHITKKDSNAIIVDGGIKIYDLEENIELQFPDDREYDTLAGFILDSLGNIPKPGEMVNFENFSFKVINLELNRIDKVEIRKKS